MFNFNPNPKYSPVWRWLGAHSVALLGLALSLPATAASLGVDPAIVANLQHFADNAKVVAGAIGSVSFALGANLPKPL